MKIRLVLTALASLPFAVFFCWAFLGRDAPATDPPRATSVHSGTGQSEPESPGATPVTGAEVREAILGQLLANQGSPEEAPQDAGPSQEPLALSDLSEEEQAIVREADRRYFEEIPKKLEAIWASETGDAEWTKRSEDTIRVMMQDHLSPQTQFEQVDCRQTLCKASFLAEDRSSESELGRQWRGFGPSHRQDLGVWSDVEGKRRATVYFTREGSGDVLAQVRNELMEDIRAEHDWMQVNGSSQPG
ncbi:MAG: hypothetical protein JW940_21400 [Polyangiaceae bacterium]|nr:hypothetical protein [Polyangiaceae bacterium]